jgi:hypothetical protein
VSNQIEHWEEVDPIDMTDQEIAATAREIEERANALADKSNTLEAFARARQGVRRRRIATRRMTPAPTRQRKDPGIEEGCDHEPLRGLARSTKILQNQAPHERE